MILRLRGGGDDDNHDDANDDDLHRDWADEETFKPHYVVDGGDSDDETQSKSLDSESNELFDHQWYAELEDYNNNHTTIDTSLLDIGVQDDDEPPATQQRTDGFQIFIKTLNGKTIVLWTPTPPTPSFTSK